jgi:hypothetical protein
MNATGYENLSKSQLHSLFSSETWKSLSFEERLNACQEVENRYAAEHNVEPCTVTHQPMEGASYGWQSGKTICLNTSMVRDGCFNVTYQDETGTTQTAQIPVMAPSWSTLETVYHEATHGIQEANGNMPSTYISPGMDGDLYRIQGIEKEAYAVGQSRTLDALNEVEVNSGKLDPDRNDYFTSVKNDSFQAALQDAAKHYNDPNIESTLQSVINDREAGIEPENQSESYKAINSLCDDYGLYASVQTGLSGETQIINDGLDDIGPSNSLSSEGAAYIDDGSSSFDESSASVDQADQSDYIDDGLSDSDNDVSSESSQSSDNGMSDGME